MTTYRYNSEFTLTVQGSTVIASNCPNYPVGTKVTVKQLRACGWRTPKQNPHWDAFGQRVN